MPARSSALWAATRAGSARRLRRDCAERTWRRTDPRCGQGRGIGFAALPLARRNRGARAERRPR